MFLQSAKKRERKENVPLKREDEFETDTPLDLVHAFERCANYPKDLEGVLALCQALRKAADTYAVRMAAIVNRCVEWSEYCPTDHDLIVVAQELRDAARRAAGGIEPWKRRDLCLKCGGTGWEPRQSRGGYESVARCSAGCAVPEPHGACLAPEVLR